MTPESYFLVSVYLASIWFAVSVVFLIAWYRSDNSVMDIFYGPTFAVAGLALLKSTETTDIAPALVTVAVWLWAGRLSWRIFRKNYGKPEDERYAAWRRAWSARGRWYFLLRSYGQINLLQGAVIAVVGSPLLFAHLMVGDLALWSLLLGLTVFVFGLSYETIADRQLDAFLARKRDGTEPTPIMQTGLFRYSRRPNYFGESMIWTGLALVAISAPFGWLALISPILITYIVTKVTGPMLEAIFLEKYPEAYQMYTQTTNYFIPGPPRPIT